MNKYVMSGGDVMLSPSTYTKVDNIPVGVYYVNPENPFLLIKKNDYDIPNKIYGNIESLSKFYRARFNDLDGNLGVMFVGEKGSGKSLLAKHICVNSNLPVLSVESTMTDFDFIAMLNSINQRVIVYIDEFDKWFSKQSDQNKLLTVMNDTAGKQKMFIFCSNDEYSISDYMKNRTSRIRYMQRFHGISENTLEDLLNDSGIKEQYANEIRDIHKVIFNINMDCITDLIQESVDLDIAPKKAIKLMNINMHESSYTLTIKDTKRYIKYEYKTDNPLIKEKIVIDCWGRPYKKKGTKSTTRIEVEIPLDDENLDISHESGGIIKMIYKQYKLTYKPVVRNYGYY